MIEPDTRKAIYELHQRGMGIRELSRRLKVSRNTVRAIISQKGKVPVSARADAIHIDLELLKKLYEDCKGYKQRMHEKSEYAYGDVEDQDKQLLESLAWHQLILVFGSCPRDQRRHRCLGRCLPSRLQRRASRSSLV